MNEPMQFPAKVLNELSLKCGLDVNELEFARFLDAQDELGEFRQKFQFPKKRDLPLEKEWNDESLGLEPCIYLGGNSLGLKPKAADEKMKEVLESWGKIALSMHFHGPAKAALCDKPGKEITAEIVGAKSAHVEIAICNGLTVNIHLLFAAFYKPEGKRKKIVIEDHAFPSDRYAITSIIEQNKLDPHETLVKLKPRQGEHTLRTEDILKLVRDNGEEISIIFLSGIQYYTGQFFDIEQITRTGQEQGCLVGWDLAHAVGNVRLDLHDWNVDFACWCTYKYMNSGAGGIAGIFMHEKHSKNPPKCLHGWWSNKEATRFDMREEVDLAIGADAFRLSNPPPWLTCLNMASLEIFHEAGMDRIVKKQFLLTGYLEHLLKKNFGDGSKMTIEILTPSDPRQRGSQLSLSFSTDIEEMYRDIKLRGVVCDFRYPNVIRVAPAPLYNTFEDVWKFVNELKALIDEKNATK